MTLPSVSDSSDDEVDFSVAHMPLNGLLEVLCDYKTWSSSRVRVWTCNKKRMFEDVGGRLERYNFVEDYVYKGRDFERRFRMPCVLFQRVLDGVTGHGLFKMA